MISTFAVYTFIYIQWKPLNRAPVYRANHLFKQFLLKKTILSFSSYKLFTY